LPARCPFCNSLATFGVTHHDTGSDWWVDCLRCEAAVSGYKYQSDAIAAWNRRDGEAARVAEAVAAELARIIGALQPLADIAYANYERDKNTLDLGVFAAYDHAIKIARAEDAP
jgi:hypothetical protein